MVFPIRELCTHSNCLIVTNGFLAYQVVAHVVDRLAKTHPLLEATPQTFRGLGTYCIIVVSLAYPRVTAMATCVAYVVLRLQAANKEKDTLSGFMTDMVAAARLEEAAPLFGHDDYIRSIEAILNRSNTPNVILVGPAGSGKTAIVKNIAAKIAEGTFDVHSPLAGKRLISVSLGGFLAGSRYRGDLEQRVEELVAFAASHPDVIYFLDEFHLTVGGGTSDAQVSIQDLLKTALSESRLRIIAATTDDEYATHVEPDPAMQRRLGKVAVTPPSCDLCFRMLQYIRPQLHKEHPGIQISDRVIAAAVIFGSKNRSGQLPDVAVTYLSTICSAIDLRQKRGEVQQPYTVSLDDVFEYHLKEGGDSIEKSTLLTYFFSRLAREVPSCDALDPT